MPDEGLFNWRKARELAQRRALIRADENRITYDCFQAVTNGDYVRCKLGRDLGTLLLRDVLEGATPKACQECQLLCQGGED